jgi:hypothetical protein
MGQHGGIGRGADGYRSECHSVSDSVGKRAACGAKTTGVQLRRDRFPGSRIELRCATEVLSFLMHVHSNARGCHRLTRNLSDHHFEQKVAHSLGATKKVLASLQERC